MNDDLLLALSKFNGTARLFPLPNLVLFPHAVQPLHIFEPRYRQMTADALEGDRLIAMALLRPGWEDKYQGRPPLFPMACLGIITADQQLPDGRYNLLLRGVARVEIVEELPGDKPYRLANVRRVHDVEPADEGDARHLRLHLASLLPPWCAGQEAVLKQFRKLVESPVPLGPFCDILAFSLPLEVAFKQQLLEQRDVAERARLLAEHLHARAPRTKAEPAPLFPPAFSAN